MKLVKIIPNDIDIDYHGKTDWKLIGKIIIGVMVFWVIIGMLIF